MHGFRQHLARLVGFAINDKVVIVAQFTSEVAHYDVGVLAR